ncbi:MAG: peroxiredoxin [Pseudomonadota bacterium]|nr:peroxiredoxin [Pseudomonadota bacterium]MDE3037694.1 peroxiredoxin [Pseudomonadota bacterium]
MSVLVGKQAPDFTATAVMPDNSFDDKFSLLNYLGIKKDASGKVTKKGKIGVLFFWPLDFTFVCPSEIIAFNNRLKEFKLRKTEVIGCSVDSHFTHLAWKQTPVEKGGIGDVQFPMVADLTKTIARDYDVLTGAAVAFRGTFLIDGNGIVRHQVVNDLPLGRNVDEAIRMVDALQFHEEHGEVCPAGWERGDEGMKATASGVASYLKGHAKKL